MGNGSVFDHSSSKVDEGKLMHLKQFMHSPDDDERIEVLKDIEKLSLKNDTYKEKISSGFVSKFSI